MPTTLTAHDINTLIDFKISNMGSAAFGPNSGFSQLYSGPRIQVRNQIIGFTRSNRVRAEDQAAGKAIILEQTPVGVFAEKFNGKGVYDYFRAQPGLTTKEKQRAADHVFAHISRKFVQSLWGEVTTAVCGAGRHRVFYKHEIPVIAETIPMLIDHLLKSNDIDAVNAVPTADVRNTYKAEGPDAAFSLICQGEMHLMHDKAMKSGRLIDFKEYLERAEMFMVERKLTANRAKIALDPIFEMGPMKREGWKKAQMRAFARADAKTIMADLAKLDTVPSMPKPLFSMKAGSARP